MYIKKFEGRLIELMFLHLKEFELWCRVDQRVFVVEEVRLSKDAFIYQSTKQIYIRFKNKMNIKCNFEKKVLKNDF